jgi:glycosyltransferase involved in cell wall biosynthesis
MIKMRANFIHSNLNPCGGGERFALVTMKAVYEMGLEIDLTTLEQPNLLKLENAFGKDLASIMKKIRKINLLNMFDEQSIHHNLRQNNYELIINTHGDIDPYYHPSLNANNMIVYCHYPSAKLFIENEDMDYLTYHLKIGRLQSHSITKSPEVISQIAYKNPSQLISQIIESPGTEINMNSHNDNKKEYAKWVKKTYDSMIRNSTLITNSNYSKAAISQEYNRDDAIVLSPPVDVEKINSKVKSNQRFDSLNYSDENCILVICRIEPSKRIENVIYLTQLLKERKIETKINIVGSFEPFYQKYYNDLIKLVSDSGVSDIVEFHIDASLEELVDLMKKSKIFFHPREGEHFGMSIVEAMSAGLIPVVPAIGGQTEFVPRQYQYNSLEEAVQIISSMLINMPQEQVTNESNKMINIAKSFSETNYKRQFQLIVSQLLYNQI